MFITRLVERSNEVYRFLYAIGDELDGYREAVEAFDDWSPKHPELIHDVILEREDLITSDREAAAFMYALRDLGLIDNQFGKGKKKNYFFVPSDPDSRGQHGCEVIDVYISKEEYASLDPRRINGAIFDSQNSAINYIYD
ncbi:MAG: hypothetical protein ACOX68_04810 [Candidatus Limivicinus sp.]|jgi:hypothetical protein